MKTLLNNIKLSLIEDRPFPVQRLYYSKGYWLLHTHAHTHTHTHTHVHTHAHCLLCLVTVTGGLVQFSPDTLLVAVQIYTPSCLLFLLPEKAAPDIRRLPDGSTIAFLGSSLLPVFLHDICAGGTEVTFWQAVNTTSLFSNTLIVCSAALSGGLNSTNET